MTVGIFLSQSQKNAMRRFNLQLALGEASLQSENREVASSVCPDAGYHLSTTRYTCIFFERQLTVKIVSTAFNYIMALEYEQKLLTQHLADNKMYVIALT
jgi:hypothetical protein